MKERPIIFGAEIVKAILDDRCTQTRRVIKPQPFIRKGYMRWVKGVNDINMDDHSDLALLFCPYGQVGDGLWVRETWRVESFMDGEPMLFGYKDSRSQEENEYSDANDYESWYERVAIQSTDEARKAYEQGLVRQDEEGIYRWDIGKSPCKWRPSIYMPHWASRITLEITGVRVERVQDITPLDAVLEGCPKYHEYKDGECIKTVSPIDRFRILWDSLNAKRGYGWDINPFVWVISFKIIKTN